METPAERMRALITRLYPICRSITGDGVRKTLEILREHLPVETHEVATGTQVLDWTVPREWNIRDAWIKNSAGERIVDFRQLNLHVVSYSAPIHRRMRLAELEAHLFTLPDHPDWVRYRTSYYQETWGFCVSERQKATLRDDEEYEVCIDSSFSDGHLTYGEYLLPGRESDEVLFSSHICHPSLANDNLSGIALAVELGRYLKASPRRYSYRFVFVPGSIGAITWLARNEENIARIRHGLVLTCVGDAGSITYKRSRRGDAVIDRAFSHFLGHSGDSYQLLPFSPYGYDERQYCSPGFNLPVGCLMRSVHGTFPEYHTSADNLGFIQDEALADSLEKCLGVIDIIEHDRTYRNNCAKGEPQLGRRGLYKGLGATVNQREREMAILWVLNLSDGEHSLLDIAARAELPFTAIKTAAESLAATDLLSAL